MTLKPLLRASLSGVLLLVVTGCGGDGESLYPVSGKVSFADGKPLTKGRVNFESDTHSAIGAIQSDGTFEMMSLEPGDGVPAGSYKIYISGAMEGGEDAHAEGGTGKPVKPPTRLIASQFESADTSPLSAEISGEKSDLDLKVEPAK